jgi:hypothetical protein
MARAEVAVKPVLIGAGVIALVVAASIAIVFALLAAWREPAGGAPSGGAALARSLRAIGPALQSAPQAERAAQADAASTGASRPGGRKGAP